MNITPRYTHLLLLIASIILPRCLLAMFLATFAGAFTMPLAFADDGFCHFGSGFYWRGRDGYTNQSDCIQGYVSKQAAPQQSPRSKTARSRSVKYPSKASLGNSPKKLASSSGHRKPSLSNLDEINQEMAQNNCDAVPDTVICQKLQKSLERISPVTPSGVDQDGGEPVIPEKSATKFKSSSQGGMCLRGYEAAVHCHIEDLKESGTGEVYGTNTICSNGNDFDVGVETCYVRDNGGKCGFENVGKNRDDGLVENNPDYPKRLSGRFCCGEDCSP